MDTKSLAEAVAGAAIAKQQQPQGENSMWDEMSEELYDAAHGGDKKKFGSILRKQVRLIVREMNRGDQR